VENLRSNWLLKRLALRLKQILVPPLHRILRDGSFEQVLAEVAPLGKLHDQVQGSAGLNNIVKLDQRRVLELPQEGNLPLDIASMHFTHRLHLVVDLDSCLKTTSSVNCLLD